MSGGPTLWGVNIMQSWAEMIGGLGTALAFGVGAWVFVQQQRDRRDDEARPARLVLIEVRQDDRDILVRATNHGPDPVTDLSFVTGRYANGVTMVTMTPPRILASGGDVLLHHESRETGPFDEESGTYPVLGDWPRMTSATITFQDARGRRWMRVDHDEPQRVRRPGRLRRLLRPVGRALRLRRRGTRSSRPRR